MRELIPALLRGFGGASVNRLRPLLIAQMCSQRLVMKSFAFEDISLFVPNLWDKDWNTATAESDGLEQRVLRAQAQYARMLKDVTAEPCTPEKVAFLSLWSRLFSLLEGASAVLESKSPYSANVLSRVAYEATLQVQVVMLPVLDSADDGGIKPEHWADFRDRLRGYIAWALHGDEKLYRHVLREDNLNAAFDRRRERDFVRELGDNLPGWERISGQQLEIVSDQESFQDRENAVRYFREKLNRASKWLSDSRLLPWRKKIAQLEGVPARNVSLFELLGAGSSVNSFLKSRGAGVGYFEYLQGSAFIHGCSLESSMLVTDRFISPDFADLSNRLEQAIGGVVSNCHLHAVLLELATKHLEA